MKLLERNKIGTLELKNRICFPPITTGFGAIDGCFSQVEMDFSVERAKGGAAMIFTDAVSIDRHHQLTFAPSLPYLDDDSLICKYSRFVDLIHHNGAKTCIQLYHAGRQTSLAKRGGKPPIGPSAVSSFMLGKIPYPDSVEMSEVEIEQTIQRFVLAASRAKNAGFDAVDIDGGAGYLIQQFMSPLTNVRKDRWGGSLENRMRFPIEIVVRVREVLGNDYPLIFDLCLNEYTEGGITPDLGVEMAAILEDTGVDGFRIHGVNMETYLHLVPTMESTPGINIPLAKLLKKHLKKAKVLLGQRINDPELAEHIVTESIADIILLGRPLIADPYFPKKVFQKKNQLIRKCIACNHCVDELAYGKPIHCILNPVVGFERDYSSFRTARNPKIVLIVGGGPAGLEAAKTAAEKGHWVILCEKSNALGGQLKYAALSPHKSELLNIVTFYEMQLSELRVDIRLNYEIDHNAIKQIKPDVVILATGAHPNSPPIEGIHEPYVLNAHQLLNTIAFDNKDSYVIIGGGSVGAEIAEMLLIHRCNVSVIELNEVIAEDMGMSMAINLHRRLERYSPNILTGAKVDRIRNKKVFYTTHDGKDGFLSADKVVLATGYTSDRSLEKGLQGLVKEVVIIGDCLSPRKIAHAIHEGFHAGRMIE
jgi:2,4-dienoyl-CoA reductase-like NADH-dependent reductase (Old Yellow Enzyme family)/thioredoxin reductase